MLYIDFPLLISYQKNSFKGVIITFSVPVTADSFFEGI